MSASKTFVLSALLAFAEARFGQEQIPVAAISALSSFGSPGEAATLAGAVPGVLLAAANPCAKLQLADKIVTNLGNDSQVISAAAALVGAERNFNPFVVSIDSFCASADLPATESLRGIVPLVDPSVVGADTENTNAKTSLTSPFDATGLSVAEVAIAHGFSNFTAVDSSGNKVTLSGSTSSSDSSSSDSATTASGSATTASDSIAAATTFSTATRSASATSSASTGSSCSSSNTNSNSNANSNAVASSSTSSSSAATASSTNVATGVNAGNGATTTLSGVDFGTCNPTIRFQGGLNGRPATEFTFQSNDANIEKVQQEALNPNIITNRICDEIKDQCNANAAAETACLAAKAKVAAIGSPADRSGSTVTVWNSALGFSN